MKKILPVLIIILSVSILYGEQKTTEHGKNATFKKFILMPADDSLKDKDFLKFIADFKKAVKEKNIRFLEENTSRNVKWSFAEGPGGIKSFIKNYGLDPKSYKDSSFWAEMDKILSLGGLYYNGEKTSFAFPYLFVSFPVNDYDPYTYAAVTGKDVNVRKNPDGKSPVVDTISYEIVKVLNPPDDNAKKEIIGSRSGSWIHIETSSGKEGYVFSYYLHSPIGYRAIFEKEKGRWVLKIFISGD